MRNFLNKLNPFSSSKAEFAATETESIRTFFGIGNSITASNAQKIATVFSCVNIRANALAVMPIKTYKREGQNKAEDRESNLYDLLRYEPNPTLTASIYKKMISQDIDLRGNHYSQIIYDGLGNVKYLYPLIADKMQIQISADNKKIYRYDGKEIANNKILHLFDIPDVSGHKGISKIQYAKQTLEFADNAAKHGNTVFKNGAAPSGSFETDQTLNDESFNRLKKDIIDKYTGAENIGTPLLLEGGLSFKPLSIKNSDSEWLASRKYNREEIASIFGVPSSMVNDTANTAYGNLEQKYLEFYSGTIFTLTTIIEESLRQSLLTPSQKKTISIKFKYNTMLRVDAKTRAEYYQTRFNIGSISPNEIRAYEDENGFDGGNECYLQLNLSTVKNLNKGVPENG